METWTLICPGPDSNRHGVTPEGFSYRYSFRCCTLKLACICGLDFTFAVPLASGRAG